MSTSAILITGASSGLGAALARHYARPGATLFLGGRDGGRLEAVAADCRARGAEVDFAIVDVTDAAAMAAWIEATDAARPLDTVIANAGVSAGSAGGEDEGQTRATLVVNLNGTVNTVLPVLPLMRRRRRGRVGLVSSLASFRGLAGAAAYCASKAAVRVWGEGLRPQLAADGITVTVVCPGFVDTPMTRVNTCPMPLLMDADRAAAIIAAGIDAGKGRVAFPWPLLLGSWLLSVLPDALADRLTRRLPAKR